MRLATAADRPRRSRATSGANVSRAAAVGLALGATGYDLVVALERTDVRERHSILTSRRT
jgi:hypothetical protein